MIENRRPAGQWHWLLMPTPERPRHSRDIEALQAEDVELSKPGLSEQHLNCFRLIQESVGHFKSVKELLIQRHCPYVRPSSIHSGYHRGRRRLIGKIFLPDIVSIHHIHLHVIVRPRLLPKIFKYPPWVPLMWKSDKRIMKEVQRKARRHR